MTERPPDTEPDAIERHPDYLPEPDFFDEDEGAEDQPPEPAPGDRDES
jgi:hypothetical protein